MNAIIALNPGQMQEAQATTLAWVDAKIAGAQADVEAAESTVATLRAYGLKPDTAEGQLNKAAKRVRFYRKVRAALALGYYIVPPFPLQLFAIRTDQQVPRDRSTRNGCATPR